LKNIPCKRYVSSYKDLRLNSALNSFYSSVLEKSWMTFYLVLVGAMKIEEYYVGETVMCRILADLEGTAVSFQGKGLW